MAAAPGTDQEPDQGPGPGPAQGPGPVPEPAQGPGPAQGPASLAVSQTDDVLSVRMRCSSSTRVCVCDPAAAVR